MVQIENSVDSPYLGGMMGFCKGQWPARFWDIIIVSQPVILHLSPHARVNFGLLLLLLQV